MQQTYKIRLSLVSLEYLIRYFSQSLPKIYGQTGSVQRTKSVHKWLDTEITNIKKIESNWERPLFESAEKTISFGPKKDKFVNLLNAIASTPILKFMSNSES